MPNLNRKSPRRKEWDYQTPGYYFVTIKVKNVGLSLSKVENGKTILSPEGEIVRESWEDLPNHYPHIVVHQHVIMPDHFHGIIQLQDLFLETQGRVSKPSPEYHAITEVIRGFKTWSARRINELNDSQGIPFWQRSFHDLYIDSDIQLEKMIEYIHNNPLQWELDQPNGDRLDNYWSPC